MATFSTTFVHPHCLITSLCRLGFVHSHRLAPNLRYRGSHVHYEECLRDVIVFISPPGSRIVVALLNDYLDVDAGERSSCQRHEFFLS